jgi:hypothetical protein
MAFIVDIRRENADLHLLYKALFDLSNDRVEFVSLLFSRPIPDGLSRGANVDVLFDRFTNAPASDDQLAKTLARVHERLLDVHHLPLQPHDVDAIDRALRAFHAAGPSIHYWGSQAIERGILRPSYARLMTMPDLTAQPRSFLASDAAFRFVKELHRKNLIVPVVGDFGGEVALRRVAAYVRDRHDDVRAFYASNVSVYLTNQQAKVFCRNLAAFPAAPQALFVDSTSVMPLSARVKSCSSSR